MKKIKLLSALAMILFAAANANAQPIVNDDDEVPPFAIGIRASPDGAGITAKYFFIPEVSVEAMINGSGGTYYNNGASATFVGLLEYNFLFNDPAWRIFMGPGAHVTSFKEYAEENSPKQTAIGLDAILGVEYVFYEVPIGVSVDIKPAINFVNDVTSFPNNFFGLSVRYYFGNWANNKTRHQKEALIRAENR